MEDCHFLFMGYSLCDWNLRVILNRIWRAQSLDLKSWAVQRFVRPIEEKLWRDRGDVELFDIDLADYIARLAAGVDELVCARAGG
jgi:hypothetical protein